MSSKKIITDKILGGKKTAQSSEIYSQLLNLSHTDLVYIAKSYQMKKFSTLPSYCIAQAIINRIDENPSLSNPFHLLSQRKTLNKEEQDLEEKLANERAIHPETGLNRSIINKIAQYLSERDRLSLSQVSKFFRYLAEPIQAIYQKIMDEADYCILVEKTVGEISLKLPNSLLIFNYYFLPQFILEQYFYFVIRDTINIDYQNNVVCSVSLYESLMWHHLITKQNKEGNKEEGNKEEQRGKKEKENMKKICQTNAKMSYKNLIHILVSLIKIKKLKLKLVSKQINDLFHYYHSLF